MFETLHMKGSQGLHEAECIRLYGSMAFFHCFPFEIIAYKIACKTVKEITLYTLEVIVNEM